MNGFVRSWTDHDRPDPMPWLWVDEGQWEGTAPSWIDLFGIARTVGRATR